MTAQDFENLIKSLSNKFTNNPNQEVKWSINGGRKNRIEGISGYKHQIDVSLRSNKEMILIECKKWKSGNKVPVSDFLVLLGRLRDISPKYNKMKIRAVLVTTSGWQKGVTKLNSYHRQDISLYKVNDVGEIAEKMHTAFIAARVSFEVKMKANLRGKTKEIK